MYTWPTETGNPSLSKDDPEVKRLPLVCNAVIQDVPSPTFKLLTHFSDWAKLVRAMAWYQKLGGSLMALAAKRKQLFTDVTTRSQHQDLMSQLQAFKSKLSDLCMSLDDLEKAERAILSYTQRQVFPIEYEKLGMAPPNVPKSSRIYRLDPMLKDGLIRIGGWLSRAALSEDMKYPIILPKQSHISSLLIRHIHERYGHCGRNDVLSQLRKRCRITSGNSAARSVISKCVIACV